METPQPQPPSSNPGCGVPTAPSTSRAAPFLKTAFIIVKNLNDERTNDANILKGLQLLITHIDKLMEHSEAFQIFLKDAIPELLKYLQLFDDISNSVRESTRNRCRKLAMELMRSLIFSSKKEVLEPYLLPILSVMFRILKKDNEETALQALKIITQVHKHPQLRPLISGDARDFVIYLTSQFQSIPEKMETLLEQKTVLRMKSSDMKTALGPVLNEISTMTNVHLEVEGGEKQNMKLIPKASNSLKVLQELPTVALLMSHLYKASLKDLILELIPALVAVISVHPTEAQRSSLTTNKEILMGLMSLQARSIRNLTYFVNLYKDEVMQHGESLIAGLLTLFELCPPEATPFRRELHTITSILLKTELCSHLLSHFEKILDEDVLLGRRSDVSEVMKSSAYKMMIECIQSVSHMLEWDHLTPAILFWCARLHDDSVPVGIQILCINLITALVDKVGESTKSEADRSEVMWRVLEVLVLKLKTVALVHLHHSIDKLEGRGGKRHDSQSGAVNGSEGFLKHFGFPVSPADNLELLDSRKLVKALVASVKEVTMRIHIPMAYMTEKETQDCHAHKAFSSLQTEIYLQMIRWGSKALDLFTRERLKLEAYDGGMQDEFEVFQEFSSIFFSMNPYTFKLLCASSIEIFFEQAECTQTGVKLTKKWLGNSHTSPIFLSSLLQYLLQRMEVLEGDDSENSTLYLKLFQQVIESVSRFPTTNGPLFCHQLSELISLTMSFALRSKRPHAYFLLLRDLFASIRKDNLDLIYLKLLPILENLLRELNRIHRTHDQQEIKDLVLDVCLATPVRYTGMLTYLPQFLDSLLIALKSSSPFVTKALEALELLIDNIQGSFFYEHFEPVRADTVQVLWKLLHSSDHSVSSFQILGKLGGKNRHMILDSQGLDFCGNPNKTTAQCLVFQFPYQKGNVSLPIEKTIEIAVSILHDQANTSDPTEDLHYKTQAWEFLKWFVLASIKREPDNAVEKRNRILLHMSINENVNSSPSRQIQKSQTTKCREVMVKALTGWMIATTVKEIQKDVYANLTSLLRYLSIQMVAQQVGPFSEKLEADWVDPYALVDALFKAVTYSEKKGRRSVIFALSVMMNTAINMMGSKERAFSLPLIDYITEKICSFCFEPTWIAKMGGIELISFFLDNAPIDWIVRNHLNLLKALLFVLADLQGQVSSGCIDDAQVIITKLIKAVCTPIPNDTDQTTMEGRAKCHKNIVEELIKCLGSSVSHVRQQCMGGLRLIAALNGVSLAELMYPYGDLLLKTLISDTNHPILHQSFERQLGVLEGLTFCLALQPPPFTLNWNVNAHRELVNDILLLADSEESSAEKVPSCKDTANFTPLKVAVLSLLSCLSNISNIRRKSIAIFLQNLTSNKTKVQRCALKSLKKMTNEYNDLMKVIGSPIVPQFLSKLTPVDAVTPQLINQLAYLYQLFPHEFNRKFWKSLLQVFNHGIVKIVSSFQKIANPVMKNEMDLCVAVLNCFSLLPKSDSLEKNFNFDCVMKLCGVFLSAERRIKLESLYKPMSKFLLNHLQSYVFSYVTITSQVTDVSWTNYFLYLIRQPESEELRKYFVNKVELVRRWLLAASENKYGVLFTNREGDNEEKQNLEMNVKYEEHLPYVAIKIIEVLHAFDENWIVSDAAVEIFIALASLWSSPSYQHKITSNIVTSLEPPSVDDVAPPNSQEKKKPLLAKLKADRWEEPHLVVELLLEYFRKAPSNYKLLFQLLLAFCGRPLIRYQFLRDFLKDSLPKFSIAWKRQCVLELCRFFKEENVGDELKAKMIQFVLIPCFVSCFQNGEVDDLIGSESESIVKTLVTEILPPPSQEIGDQLRISLYQLSSLLIDQASSHVRGEVKRKLWEFALPALHNDVKISVKFYGIKLLCHFYAKFSIDTSLKLPSNILGFLLRSVNEEMAQVKNQALDVLIPALLSKQMDGHSILLNQTQKLLIDSPTLGQTAHLVDLISRQWNKYFPIRHGLSSQLCNVMDHLLNSPVNPIERNKMAVDLAEVMIKWELKLISRDFAKNPENVTQEIAVTEDSSTSNWNRSLSKSTVKSVLNLLIRVACYLSNYEERKIKELCNKCVKLLKSSLSPTMWGSVNLDNLKLDWMREIFSRISQPNYISQVVMTLNLFTILVWKMSEKKAVETLCTFRNELTACMKSQNATVMKMVRLLIQQLMKMFPSDFQQHDATMSMAPKHKELSFLQEIVNDVVFEGLSTYVTISQSKSYNMWGASMMLLVSDANNPNYIDDSKLSVVVKCLEKLTDEHLNGRRGVWAATDMLKSFLEIAKSRVQLMKEVTKKGFIENVLHQLIEKSKDERIMKVLVTMLEEWMCSGKKEVVTQGPYLEEKSVLIVKMMENVDKRFSKNPDLMSSFLNVIHCIYKNTQQLKATELSSQLEPALLRGLCSSKQDIREKFFEIFDERLKKKRLFERLMFILSNQNWEGAGSQYWIKQCVEILLVTVQSTTKLEMTPQESYIPSLCHRYTMKDLKAIVGSLMPVSCEGGQDPEQLGSNQQLEKGIEALVACKVESEVDGTVETVVEAFINEGCSEPLDSCGNLKIILKKDQEWKNGVVRNGLNANSLLKPLIQLCHLDTRLADHVWKQLLPQVWKLFSEKQRITLMGHVMPFLCSGAHLPQQGCSPNAVSSFVDALFHCEPEIPLKSMVARYLGKSYNLWHRMTLYLEQLTYNQGSLATLKAKTTADTTDLPDILDNLSELYEQLGEDDLWTGLWKSRVKYPPTSSALAFEQQGKFEESQIAYEEAMNQARVELTSSYPVNSEMGELKLLEKQWMKCNRELNQWDIVEEYSKSGPGHNWSMTLEAAFQNGSWGKAQEALSNVELACPREEEWKLHLFKGLLSITGSNEQETITTANNHHQKAAELCIREWQRLPLLVSNAHIGLLQAAQQVMELVQATENRLPLLSEKDDVPKEIYNVVKPLVVSWESRLPCISDGLSYWSNILNWRAHHLQLILEKFAKYTDGISSTTQNTGVQRQMRNFIQHHKCQKMINLGEIARKQNLNDVSLETLENVTPASIAAYLEKLKQQVKCVVKQPGIHRSNAIQETLQAMESVDIQTFGKNPIAEFFALKGILISQLDRYEEADKAFSASLSINDSSAKSWAYWGNYLEQRFVKHPNQINIGTSAITALIQACQHRNEAKGRKYIAKILWLLMFDDEKGTLAEVVIQFSKEVPPVHWLPWLPQLVGSLARGKGNNKMAINLLNHVGKFYPQAVYLHIRTPFLNLKRKARIDESLGSGTRPSPIQQNVATPSLEGSNSQETSSGDEGVLKNRQLIQLCSKIMQRQLKGDPITIPSLDTIMNQLMRMRETWYEELRKWLKMVLASCYDLMHQNSSNIKEAVITPELQNTLKTMVLSFGKVSGDVTSVYRRIPEDPNLEKLQMQLTEEFGAMTVTSSKLIDLVEKLRHWIQLTEKYIKSSTTLTAESGTNYLEKFNEQIAEIDIPGEYLLPKHPQHYVKISRFEPKVDIVVQHKHTARRIRIRGDNGKIYSYLVTQDETIGGEKIRDTRTEQRVLQLMRMLNSLLAQKKETARRNMQFCVPKLVQISPVSRLVEDNISKITLEDIYKSYCKDMKQDVHAAIRCFYDSLGEFQTKGGQSSHFQLRKLFHKIEASFVPKMILKSWALKNFSTASDYWMFRKVFTRQICLIAFAEHTFHLSPVNPEMMNLHQDSGMISVSYFEFRVANTTSVININQSVSFRLTPSISEFISPFGIHGSVVGGIIGLAGCLLNSEDKVTAILRALFIDEVDFHLRNGKNDATISQNVIQMVKKVIKVVRQRLESLSKVKEEECMASKLVAAAMSDDNLCRMDPAWFPWL